MIDRASARGAAVLAGLLLSFLPPAAAAQEANLTVRVAGADPATGTVEVSLFNTAEGFMKDPYLQRSQPVGENGTVAATFYGVPFGDYAVVVAHDANDNGELDRGFLGIGGEDYGWSNNVHPWFGWPAFEDARFTVAADTEIEIDLNR
jgi:uncharacterized protein (DUF2141 family)